MSNPLPIIPPIRKEIKIEATTPLKPSVAPIIMVNIASPLPIASRLNRSLASLARININPKPKARPERELGALPLAPEKTSPKIVPGMVIESGISIKFKSTKVATRSNETKTMKDSASKLIEYFKKMRRKRTAALPSTIGYWKGIEAPQYLHLPRVSKKPRRGMRSIGDSALPHEGQREAG